MKYEIWWYDSEIVEANSEEEAWEILRKRRPPGANNWGVDEIEERREVEDEE